MKPVSRLLVVVGMVSALALTGFGCKGLSKEEMAATRPVKLEYWTVFDDVDAINKVIEAYRADRPYLTVNVRQLRQEELYPRLVEALAEDRGPDIISVSNRNLGQFISKLAPMPASVRDTLVRVEKTSFDTKTTVIPVTRPTVTQTQLDREYVKAVKADVVRNGSIYGLPLSMDTMVLYYNKDLLDRAGVPEPPKNWQQFQEAVKKATKYDKSTGVITQAGAALGTGSNVPWSDDLLYILYGQSQLTFTDRNGRAVFNGAARQGEESAQMNILNFYTDFANQARDTYTWNNSFGNAVDAFVSGKLTFMFGYYYHLPIIRSRAPQLNFEVLPMLQLSPDAPVNTAYYSIQTVTAKSKNQNEAWGLINYMARDNNKTYLELSGRPTALRAYIAQQQENLVLAPFASQLLIATNWYRGGNYDAAVSAMNDLFADWLKEPPQADRALEWRQDLLNRAASRVNQTL